MPLHKNTIASLFPENTAASTRSEYLVRFVSTAVEGVYAIQHGNGKFWGGTNGNNKLQATNDVNAATYYFAHAATQSTSGAGGIAIINTVDLINYGSRVDNDGAGNTVGFWDTGDFNSGDNNVFYLYPVTLTDIQQYEYTVNVTGAEESVTINGTTVPNGGSYISEEPIGESNVICPIVEHYTAYVTISGTTINVNYMLTPMSQLSQLEQGHVYTITSAASANKLSFRFEEVLTAIEAVESNNSAAEIFDLQGRRLSKAQKGMNIINGHKVLVK